MNSIVESQIKKFISDKDIKKRSTLSKSFGMICEKITLSDNSIFVAKYYENKNYKFNSILSETNSLLYLSQLKSSIFPKI